MKGLESLSSGTSPNPVETVSLPNSPSLATAEETWAVFPGTNMGQRSFTGKESAVGRNKDVGRAEINPEGNTPT